MYYVAFSEVVAYLMLQQTCTSYSVPSAGTHPGGGAAHWSLYVMVKAKIIHQSARHIFCCLTTLAPLTGAEANQAEGSGSAAAGEMGRSLTTLTNRGVL